MSPLETLLRGDLPPSGSGIEPPISGYDPTLQGPPQKTPSDIKREADPLGTMQTMDKYLGPNMLSAAEKMVYMRYMLTTPFMTGLRILGKEGLKGQTRGMLKEEMKRWEDKMEKGKEYEYKPPKILRSLHEMVKGAPKPHRGPPMARQEPIYQLLDLIGGS